MTVLNQDSKDLMDFLLVAKKFSTNMFACISNILEDDLDPIGLANYHDVLKLIYDFDEQCDIFSAALIVRKECEIKEQSDELLRRIDKAINM